MTTTGFSFHGDNACTCTFLKQNQTENGEWGIQACPRKFEVKLKELKASLKELK